MFSIKKIGDVVKNYEDIEIEWKIMNFFANAENEEEFTCPTFSFMDTTWHFRMHPKSKRKLGFVNLYLVQVGNLTCSVEYCFGLKKLDGSVSGEHLRNGILTVKSESRTENGILHRYADSVFFKLLEVEHRKSELLLPSDTLTVICMLKREIAHSHQKNILKPHKLQKFTRFYSNCVILEGLSVPVQMFSIKKIGNVKKNHEDTEIEWKITNFFTVAENEEEFVCPNFSFVDTSWYFHMYLRSKRKPKFVNLCLVQMGNLEHSVEYYFGLKKLDNSVSIEHLHEGILTVESPNNTKNGMPYRYTNLFFELSELQRRKSELVPSDTLTVTCMLKCEITHSHQVKMVAPPKLQKFMKLETLSENFKSLLLNKESYDTTLLVKDKEYKAHRAVLMARSSVFGAMFKHETPEKQTGIVNIPDCDPESFGEFLEFLYTGKLEKPLPHSALHLYETSEKYNVEELKTQCLEFLMGNLTIEILCDAAILADKYDDAKLLCVAQCFFTKNLSNILVTPRWECFMKNDHRLANKLLTAMSSKVKAVD